MHDTLHQLRKQYSLNLEQSKQLWHIAGLGKPNEGFPTQLQRFLLVVGFLFVGLGAVFWVAANWQTWGRFSKLGLLEAGLCTALLVAALAPMVRQGALLLAIFLLGAVLAFIGQTYQTGADPWQLFAIWALLAVPLMMAGQRDGLWVVWIVIAATAIGLWVTVRATGLINISLLSVWNIGLDWLIWFGLVAVAYGIQTAGWAGIKPKWTLRISLLITLSAITLYCCAALVGRRESVYLIGLTMTLFVTGVLWIHNRKDFAALCIAALCVDVMLFAGCARLLNYSRFETVNLLVIGLFAAGIVGGTLSLLLKWYRHDQALELTAHAPQESIKIEGAAS